MNTKGLETNTQTIERLTKERDEARAACAEMRNILLRWKDSKPLKGHDVWVEKISTDFLKEVKHALSSDCGNDFVHRSRVGCSPEVAQKVRETFRLLVTAIENPLMGEQTQARVMQRVLKEVKEALALLDKEGAK